ncbi:mechanosensitive ion channel family protein [Thermocoleostomius sinensis]|uniref:Mechanosensitive ion channel n=1 Tax=Thermocoleostomius sinensis A174 TaxID=2016057 RepID=A0A9E8ZG40_9CYAN|nr:mechanosensitive ion channel domain-containing protein [Thermocoleostomius sinensis]WAL62422.1 mechanosensitive ion channel [Thermocoleostomius sinensis A174]
MRLLKSDGKLIKPLRIARVIGLAFIVGLLFSICFDRSPAIAQETSPLPRASVVVDGTELFQLGSPGTYEAEERAEKANRQIRTAITTGQPPSITVSGSEQLPTLELNGEQLLTITEEDLVPGQSGRAQAREWAERIETAIEQAQEQRTSGYLRIAAIQAIIAALIALLLHWSIGRFWRRTLTPELRTITQVPDPDSVRIPQYTSLDLLLGFLLIAARVGIWLVAVLYISNLFPWTRQWSYRLTEILISSFVSPIVVLGENRYSIVHLLILAGLFFALEIVTKTITNLLKTRVLRLTVTNRGTREVIAILIRYSLLFIGAMVLLQIWGIDLSSLALLASALGLGIGLGLQDIAKDIGSGVVLLFERPIQVGDFVQVGEYEGTIELIGARSTLIRTLDHISIIVPNSRFLSAEVINWSHHNPVSRLHLPVGVAYGSDMNAVRSALLEAAQEHHRVLINPKPQVFFKGFGDSSLNLELLVWTAEPSKHILIKSELYFKIEEKFRKYSVEIPFPQQDLHVRSGNLPIDLSPEFQQTLQQLLKLSQNGQASHTDKTVDRKPAP